MNFENSIDIGVARDTVWDFLWDVDRLISCVPGCEEAATVEAGKLYNAKMVARVGPFKVTFPIKIEVLENEPKKRIKARASGSDNKIGSHLKVELDVSVEEKGEATQLSFVASVDVLGKLATLGHSIIKRKADNDMVKFADAVKKELEGGA
jgi:carbon monoxide dehydrogenase subunit G